MTTKKLDGKEVLAEVLRGHRWDDQGGYSGYEGDGKWNGGILGLTDSDKIMALFELAGVVPDVIVSLGSCDTCAHSRNGQEQGYVGACSPCKRPKMHNWVPLYRKEQIEAIDRGRERATAKHGTCPYLKRRGNLKMIKPGLFWCSFCGAEVLDQNLVAVLKPLDPSVYSNDGERPKRKRGA